ncbi:MAG: fibronectin type III domain-containing protein, partial [Chloroflexota bacterium]|nr:fibronectin type III domain-containing protein [Chloroflexota bacterium]
SYTVERTTTDPSTATSPTWTELTAALPANTNSYADTSVNPATQYYYRIKASNVGGDSAYSNVASDTTPDTTATAPTGLSATAVSPSRIDLGWTDNSSNETGFVLERSVSSSFAGATSIALAANTTSYSDTGLSAGTYYYRVKATNSGGDSAYSNVASTATLPAAPTGLTATAVSSSRVDLSWTDNASNEDSYTVERSLDGTTGWTVLTGTLAANTNSYADTSVNPATKYYYRVKASNAGGDSAYSNTASTTTPDVAPAAPSGLTATAVSSSRIDLRWTDNSTNEDSFVLERSTASSFGTIDKTVTLAANTTSYADSTVAASTTYYYRVKATNAAGSSGYSNTASATTPAATPTAPAAPSGLTATAASSSKIDLSWTDNASNEDSYTVERSLDGSTGWTVLTGTLAANTNSYADTSVSPATKYYYRVKASNSGGDSAYSSTASATTTSALPAAPSNLTAQVAGTGTKQKINLKLLDNSTNETGFVLERSLSSDFGVVQKSVTLAANSTNYSDTGLNASTKYYYRVKATNSAGSSAYSNVASTTTK